MYVERINEDESDKLECYAHNRLYSNEVDLKEVQKRYYNKAVWNDEETVEELLDVMAELLFEVDVWRSFGDLIAAHRKTQGWDNE